MGYDMHAGEICKVQRQLKVDGVLAFGGEHWLLKQAVERSY